MRKAKIADTRADDFCSPRWKAENPRRYWALMLFLAAQYRARKRDLPCDITVDWVEQLLIDPVCDCCGNKVQTTPAESARKGKWLRDRSATLDKVIPSLGYVKENVRLLCFLCNRIKTNASYQQVRLVADWYEQIYPIVREAVAK